MKLFLELFINKKIEYTFVHFISDRSLVTYVDIFCILPETRVLFDHTGQVE
jgi:hypothetical protein